jgi:hypothetical protein
MYFRRLCVTWRTIQASMSDLAPVDGTGAKTSFRFLSGVRLENCAEHLRRLGCEAARIKVPYEFQRGGGEMLRIRAGAAP